MRAGEVERSFSEQAVAALIRESTTGAVHLVIRFSWFKLIDLHSARELIPNILRQAAGEKSEQRRDALGGRWENAVEQHKTPKQQ